MWETTSGLPDDSREEDERQEERWLRDLRGRVKAARALVSCTLGLAEKLARDWRKAARFYDRFGVTESQFLHGVDRLGTGSMRVLTAQQASLSNATSDGSGTSGLMGTDVGPTGARSQIHPSGTS